VPNSKLVSLPVDAEGNIIVSPELLEIAAIADAMHLDRRERAIRGVITEKARARWLTRFDSDDRAAHLAAMEDVLPAVLAALPEAVVVGAGDANDLAFLISRETDVLPDTAWHAANALLAAGYRKTVILDRSRLIEEIAKIQGRNDAHEIDCGDAVPCHLCLDRATALLARVEDDR